MDRTDSPEGDPVPHWRVSASDQVLDDPAVSAALCDLASAVDTLGGELVTSAQSEDGGTEITLKLDQIDIDTPEGLTGKEARLISEAAYRIDNTLTENGRAAISANTMLGLAYGIHILADRIEVEHGIPEIDGVRYPVLPYRLAACPVALGDSLEGPGVEDVDLRNSREQFENLIQKAIRHGYNLVVISKTDNFIPWKNPEYAERSRRYRKHLAVLVETAHEYHLRILLMGDEFTYLPDTFEGEESIKNDALWDALQRKYRTLLAVCPTLDGVATRIGETIPRYDFRTLDLIHSEEDSPDPRIEERYRKFIMKMHEVVSGEYGKIYLNRTWVTNVHEQHSVPQVYERTFTPEVPKEDLLLAIKLTTGDQWYHCEPFNTTFGVTDHTTIAQGEIYSGYQGRGTYIDYPAMYFQAAVEWSVDRGAKGIFTGVAWQKGYGTGLTSDAILYVFSHLGWDPYASAEDLTADWVSKTFGPEARDEIARIFLLGAVAVRDGIYLRQPGLHNWEPLRQIRTNDYILEGNPEWDNGRAHDEFLKEIYLECKPWFEQTIRELDYGVEVAGEMIDLYQVCRDRISDPEMSAALGKLVRHGFAAINLNAAYMKSVLKYFRYRERPDTGNRADLEGQLTDLRKALEDYHRDFDYYETRAIPAFIELAERALDDLEAAERILMESPTKAGVKEMFARARREEEAMLEDHPDAVHVASWSGTIDGRDLLMIDDEGFEIKHISDDQITAPVLTRHNPMPREPSCRIVVDRVKVRGNVFVQEQPSEGNGYTLTLYLEDREPGPTPFRFDIYAVCGE